MILFISPYQNAPECATLIERARRESVKLVDSLRLGMAALKAHEFTAVVADENLLACTPGSVDAIVQRLGTAVPVFLDMACVRPERVVKYVSSAYRRREVEYDLARRQAKAELRSEFKSELTGLLLASEMALKAAGTPAKSLTSLNNVLEIAKRIKSRLQESEG